MVQYGTRVMWELVDFTVLFFHSMMSDGFQAMKHPEPFLGLFIYFHTYYVNTQTNFMFVT